MKVTDLALEGVKILEPRYFEDDRGYYVESYSKRTFESLGLTYDFVQDNHSFSAKKGILRGVHFQNNPKAQTKLVRCVRGSVLDVVVDLRKDSPTYKQWLSVLLSAENRKQLLIPKGYGHGFIALEDNCEFQYKVDAFYEPSLDRAIQWNDPELNIDWGTKTPIISVKDQSAPSLADSDVNFLMEEV